MPQFHHGGLPSPAERRSRTAWALRKLHVPGRTLFCAKSTKKAVYAALSSVGYGNTDELCIGKCACKTPDMMRHTVSELMVPLKESGIKIIFFIFCSPFISSTEPVL